MTFTVRPSGDGGWLAFASGPRLLVTPVPLDGTVDAAWAAIGDTDGFRLSLELLASRGVAATPPFVLVEWIEGAEARIILRGDASLSVTADSTTEPLSAAGVSSWVERRIPGVTGIHIVAPGGTAIGTAALPFVAGVALVSEVAFGAPGVISHDVSTSMAELDEPENELRQQPASAGSSPDQVAAAPATHPEVDVEETVREAPDAVSFVTESSVASPGETDDAGYDYLFGDTMYRSVADAVVHEPAAVDDPGPDGDANLDDALHDGETVLTSDIAKIRGKRRPRPDVGATEHAPAQQLVIAVSTTGARESLDQPILVGRSPSVNKVSSGELPRMLTVGTPDQDISRNHVQLSLEGGTVVVTDLHSRNGTMIELPGKSPQKLRAGEPTSVILGTIIDLGSGVTLTVEDDATRIDA